MSSNERSLRERLRDRARDAAAASGSDSDASGRDRRQAIAEEVQETAAISSPVPASTEPMASEPRAQQMAQNGAPDDPSGLDGSGGSEPATQAEALARGSAQVGATGVAGPEDTPGNGSGDDGGGTTGGGADDPTGIAGPEDTPDPAGGGDDGGGNGGTGGDSGRSTGGGSRSGGGDGRGGGADPTGIAGPEDTPDPAGGGSTGGGGGRSGGRPDPVADPTGTGREEPPTVDPAPTWATSALSAVGSVEPDPEVVSAFEESEAEGLFGEDVERPLRDVRERSREFQTFIRRGEGGAPPSEEGIPERALEGAATAGVGLLTTPATAPLAADQAVETAQAAPGVVEEFGPEAVATTGAGVAINAGEAAFDAVRERPVRTAAGLGVDLVAGAGLSRATGVTARTVRDRVRTRGGTEIDATDFAGEDVVRFQETGGAEGTRFPPFRDPELARDDPAAAVREQSQDFTPEEIEQEFAAAGVERGDRGADLTKALDVEPDEPGFQTQGGGFESPGAFFGPELSPNFLRLQSRGGVSFRPGLPDMGGRPTGIVARTDVENPEADTMAELNEELRGAEGDTTARTKPASEISPGEAEAIVPPGAQFEPVGSERFFTTIGGRRVPIRTVAPTDRETDVDVDVDTAARDPGGQTLDDLSESVRPPRDRATPPVGSTTGTGSSNRGSRPDGPAPPTIAPVDSGDREPPSDPDPTGGLSGSAPPTPPSIGPIDSEGSGPPSDRSPPTPPSEVGPPAIPDRPPAIPDRPPTTPPSDPSPSVTAPSPTGGTPAISPIGDGPTGGRRRPDGDEDRLLRFDRDESTTASDPSALEAPFVPSFAAETFAGFAGVGGLEREAPDQATLEGLTTEFAPGGLPVATDEGLLDFSGDLL